MNAFRAAVRRYSRPAPCGADSSDRRLPLPVTTYERVPIEPGISPHSPAFAEIAPLRDSHTSFPKCRSWSV